MLGTQKKEKENSLSVEWRINGRSGKAAERKRPLNWVLLGKEDLLFRERRGVGRVAQVEEPGSTKAFRHEVSVCRELHGAGTEGLRKWALSCVLKATGRHGKF